MDPSDQNRDGSGDAQTKCDQTAVMQDEDAQNDAIQDAVVPGGADIAATGAVGEVGTNENWPTADASVAESSNDNGSNPVNPTNLTEISSDDSALAEQNKGVDTDLQETDCSQTISEQQHGDTDMTESTTTCIELEKGSRETTADFTSPQTETSTCTLEKTPEEANESSEAVCCATDPKEIAEVEVPVPTISSSLMVDQERVGISDSLENFPDAKLSEQSSVSDAKGFSESEVGSAAENDDSQSRDESLTETKQADFARKIIPDPVECSSENVTGNLSEYPESTFENIIPPESKFSKNFNLSSVERKQLDDGLSLTTLNDDSCLESESLRSEDASRLSPLEASIMSSVEPNIVRNISPVEGFLDENSSAACDTEMMETLEKKSVDAMEGVSEVTPIEDSNDAASGTNTRKRHGSGGSATYDIENDIHGAFPAANLFEYQWPQETGAEWYMLQEQISEFLVVKSFKRKYPELQRRPVDMNEKVFLRDRGVVSETQCDLGLTALKSEEVLDLMIRDYPLRYREYAAVLQEKERQTISDKHKKYDVPKFEKSKLADYMKKAVKSAAEFNQQFQRERREERKAYFDLQTMAIHYPQSKRRVLPPESTKVGSYPVALIPGQFQDYYKQYNSDELKYFPINTAVYGPPKRFRDILAQPSTGDTDEDSDDSAEDQDGADSSSEEDSSDGESVGVAPLAPPPDPAPQDPPSSNKIQRPKREKPEDKLPDRLCRICKTDNGLKGTAEDLVQCSECKTSGHAVCLELTTEMIPVIRTYPWQCMECKTCVECMDPYDEDKMMFCDRCDRGYHTFCVGVKSIPTGQWECPSCKDMPSKPKKSRRRTRQQNGVPSPKPTPTPS